MHVTTNCKTRQAVNYSEFARENWFYITVVVPREALFLLQQVLLK